jgi:hypothetical protein
MKKASRVLWVEDAASYDLSQLAAPLIMDGGMDGGYDLTIADNASDAIARLQQSEFEAVIVDIRIPPGDDGDWIGLYYKLGKDRIGARLGRELLYAVLGHKEARIRLGDRRPAWLTPRRIGVLTVESPGELEEDLHALGIAIYQHKTASMPVASDALLNLVKAVISQSTDNEGAPQ